MHKSLRALALRHAIGGAALALLAALPAAGASLHTSAATFFAALPGPATTLDFEAFAAGTPIPSGSALGAITFTYAIDDGAGGALALQVSDAWDATSGTRALGLEDPANGDQLVAGDAIAFGFATPARALGIYLIASDPLLAGDARLVGGGLSAPNGAALATLPDGGLVYFLGLVADGAFAGATLEFDAGAAEAFLFTLDDVTHVLVPEPTTLALLGGALACLARRRPRAITLPREDAP